MYRNTFGESVVYGANPPTTERQLQANQHDYLMVGRGRRNIPGPDIYIAMDKEGERLGYNTPSRKMYGALLPPYEGTRKKECDGKG
jgi:hypothetical protein